jgi:methylated-DNA-[protein]-cysteine S-methyltransferase
VHRLTSAMQQFFSSGSMSWDLTDLDWDDLTEFQRRVLRACFEIPAGSTWTYGRLARAVGSAGAARAVGGVMSRNRWPLLIPCHRVVGSSGKLVGYSGTGGLATKQRLLELESSKVGTQQELFT